jgi:hypothetical protein
MFFLFHLEKLMADEPTKFPTKKSIVVAGDVFTDHHLYEGRRHAPAQDERLNLLEVTEAGGSALLVRLLEYTCGKSDGLPYPEEGAQSPVQWSVSHSPQQSDQHAYAYWSPFPRTSSEEDKKGPEFWRVRLPMGYGESAVSPAPLPAAATNPGNPPEMPWNILVLDDAGFRFRHQTKEEWLLSQAADSGSGWIVLKMSRPVAQGELWYELLAPSYAERLICVVSVDELRQECISISPGLSWERAVEEVRGALHCNPEVAALTRCRHLIVRFAADGALWVDFTNRDAPTAWLVFDAAGIEGSWDDRHEGTVVGSSTAFAAAVVHGLAQFKPGETVQLVAAIKSGLAAVRDLEEFGHGEKGKPPSGFPAQRLSAVIRKGDAKFGQAKVLWPKRNEYQFAEAPVPQEATVPQRTLVPQETWMIVEDFHHMLVGDDRKSPIVGLAREIVRSGESALDHYPHARFRDLLVIDRQEIELLRSVRRLMRDYRKNEKAEKPLSIGIFGPPGAGKSFGVKQLANEIFTEKAWLEFNLSQFSNSTDLVGAFHQVRDKVLSGVTPVVFWDEFDSKDLDWLQYLLAPMQDGRFQHEQLSHWIGKCVFVFAGGTSTSFETFSPPLDEVPRSAELEQALTHFKLKKGPDFHSRLDGYYDVVGPNPRAKRRDKWTPNQILEPDPNDVCYPLRRALLIRNKLKCGKDEMDFDPDLLDALLSTQKFKHGARSLEKLIANLRVSGGKSIRRSALLALPLRGMHVEDEAFERALNRNTEFFMSPAIDRLAELIHQMWLEENADDPDKPAFNLAFDKLPLVFQDDNRAAARRIPSHLALVGLAVARKDSKEAPGKGNKEEQPSREWVEGHLASPLRIEHLAEAEHNGWMRQRFATGWRFGEPRNDDRKIHSSLKAYSKLSEDDQERDRRKICNIPKLLDEVGYRVVWWEYQ